jgi:hypothetical protein
MAKYGISISLLRNKLSKLMAISFADMSIASKKRRRTTN